MTAVAAEMRVRHVWTPRSCSIVQSTDPEACEQRYRESYVARSWAAETNGRIMETITDDELFDDLRALLIPMSISSSV